MASLDQPGPSVDVRTSATLALEGYRERISRMLDLVDDAAAGRVDFPLDSAALESVVNECMRYVLNGEASVKQAFEAMHEHMAKVNELHALDAEVLALGRALRARCEQRTRRLAEFDAAVLNARHVLKRIDAAAAQAADLDTLVRSAERLGYTRAPPRSFLSGARRDIAPMLPGRPGDAEQRASRLFELQALAAAPAAERRRPEQQLGAGSAAPPHLRGDVLACLIAPLSAAGMARSAAAAGSALGGAWLDERQWFGVAAAAPAAAAPSRPTPLAEGGSAPQLQAGLLEGAQASPEPSPGGASGGGSRPMDDGPEAASAAASGRVEAAALPAAGGSQTPAATAAGASGAPDVVFPPAVLAAMAEAGFPPGWRLSDPMPACLRGRPPPPSLLAAFRAARQQQQQPQRK